MVVDVDLDSQQVGEPRLVYDQTLGGAFGAFDVHPTDGRLLVLRVDENAESLEAIGTLRRQIEFIINWNTELFER